MEIFKICKVILSSPTTYLIKDLHDDVIKGSFYDAELQKTKHKNVYLVDRILERKKVKGKRMALVHWYGYNETFNEWIPEAHIKDLKVENV